MCWQILICLLASRVIISVSLSKYIMKEVAHGSVERLRCRFLSGWRATVSLSLSLSLSLRKPLVSLGRHRARGVHHEEFLTLRSFHACCYGRRGAAAGYTPVGLAVGVAAHAYTGRGGDEEEEEPKASPRNPRCLAHAREFSRSNRSSCMQWHAANSLQDLCARAAVAIRRVW